MPEQHTAHHPLHSPMDPDAALSLLDEVWAYYTPIDEPTLADGQYVDFPHAATLMFSDPVQPIP